MKNKKIAAALLLASSTLASTIGYAGNRPVCQVEHGKNIYSDNTIRVSNYGFADDVKENCGKLKAEEKTETTAAVAPTLEIKKNIETNLEVKFNTGSAQIDENYTQSLAELATALKADRDSKLIVRGHTDNIGNPDLNKKLSAERALAIREFLINSGVDQSRVVAEGIGADQPVADNSSKEGRAQNRRTTFEVK